MSNVSLQRRADNARLRRETIQDQLRIALMERKLKFLNKYDVLETANQKRRRVPSPESVNEDKTLKSNRGKGVALCRDLQRNFTGAAAALNQFRVQAVGIGPKLRLHSKTDPAGVKDKADWFNRVWAKQCDFRGTLHYADQVGLALMTLKREGDLLVVFDDFGLADKKPTGKLLWYESDQLVEVSDLKAKGGEWSKYEQESGVLFDKWGREVGYAVTPEHGQTSAPFAKVTIYPAERARLLRHVWRCNQKRGTAPILTGAADLQDLYELQSKELQTAKVQSSMAGVIKKAAAADDQDYPRTEGTDPGPTYKTLEAFLGGGMEYLERDDSFEMLNYNRPEVDFVAAINQLGDKAVTPLGITKTYARLATDSSYTAFRGDMLITWAQFYCDQKMLERYLCDWTAEKALAWKFGKLPDDMTASWDWPRMPAVDPLQEAEAIALELKTAQTNYAEKFGPEWIAKAEQLAREIVHLKDLGLPTVFEGEKEGLSFKSKGGAGDGKRDDQDSDQK